MNLLNFTGNNVILPLPKTENSEQSRVKWLKQQIESAEDNFQQEVKSVVLRTITVPYFGGNHGLESSLQSLADDTGKTIHAFDDFYYDNLSEKVFFIPEDFVILSFNEF